MKRIALFLLVTFGFSCTNKKIPPNIVFILVDDLGWTDVSYNNSEFYETPNIDALSSKSVIFTNAYASGSVCSPSRAAILTGKHPARLGITDWIPGQRPKGRKLNTPAIPNELQLDEITFAEVLKTNGYKTFFAGKWHLGGQEHFPENQGFDVNIGGHEKGSPPGGYYVPYKNPKLNNGPEGEYLTDRLTSESIKFLGETAGKPFLLYLNYYTVHTPIQANLSYIDKFERKLRKLDVTERTFKYEREAVTMTNQFNPAYASMVYALDKNIGKLIDKLKSEGLYENTLIIFTSDNGGLSTLEQNGANLRKAPTSVKPLRGGKGWLYEGGIRVPLLIKPPKNDDNKLILNEPVIGHDFFPTILSYAGINTDTNTDGRSLRKLIEKGKKLERQTLFWHYPHYHGSGWKPGAAVRMGDYKLIEFYEEGKTELYNLKTDISETKNLCHTNPEKCKELQKVLLQQQSKHNALKVSDSK